MKKLIVDGKEAEFDHSGGLKPLSEEELEGVHGGVFIKDGTMLYRWHCLVEGCGAIGDWSTDFALCYVSMGSHNQLTGHNNFQREDRIL